MERAALLAGRWYPGDPTACREAIEQHAAETDIGAGDYAGLIGPHAGWAFSGDSAARAYRWAQASRPDAELVVIFGSHRGPTGPNTVFRGEGWDTPLGALATDRALSDELAGALSLDDEPIRPSRADNAVELHLPFMKFFWPEARFLMLGVAAADVAIDIGRAVGERLRGRDAVVIGSTDLTHYGPNYGFSPAGAGPAAVDWVREVNDAGFLDALVRDAPREAIAHATDNGSACCPGAAVAALEAVRAMRGHVETTLVDHTLSYDVRPDASFVGYGSLAL